MQMNPEQVAIVRSPAKRILAICGAGSGKSRTLVERIRQNIADGADPAKILAISYTQAAARVMQERLGDIRLGACSTLHAFLLRLIGEHHARLGLPETISVFDDDNQEALVETIMAEMGVKVPVSKVMPLLELAAMINPTKGISRTKPELVAIEFHSRLRQGGLLSFDSILFYGHQVIRQLADCDQWKYTHFYGDEWQDAAIIDCQIVEAMPCEYKFLVGDTDQKIMGFRGACDWLEQTALAAPGNGWTVFNLEKNYRCRAAIAAAAQNLISHNVGRFPKVTSPVHEGGEVTVTRCGSPASELSHVLTQIQAAIATGAAEASGIAILARTNALARQFADHLKAMGIPVAERRYQEVPADWKTAKAFLTVLANRYNDMAVHNYLVLASGKPFADKMRQTAAVKMVALYEVALPQLKGADGKAPVAELGIAGISAESRERVHDACRLLSANGGWTINDLILYLNADANRETKGEGVSILTGHQSKGREFRHVHIVGFEEGLFPMLRKDSVLEEDRRLAYVCITRAMETVSISYCESRPKPFSREMVECKPSRFIAEAGISNAKAS